jgi:hypothetical protein
MPRKPFLTEPISYLEAGKYLADIKDSTLRNVYKTHLGGTFKYNKLKKFSELDGFSGLMFWFCLDQNNLFLACEPKFNFVYPKNDVVFSENLQPEQDTLLKPGSVPFGVDLNGISDHVQFLKNHSRATHLGDKSIRKSKVIELKGNYVKDPKFKYHQKYGHAYFGNEEGYVTNFLNIDGIKNVRYYFGYGTTYVPNYIRLILVPVNSRGENIQLKKSGSSGELLQRSVPPPPIQ